MTEKQGRLSVSRPRCWYPGWELAEFGGCVGGGGLASIIKNNDHDRVPTGSGKPGKVRKTFPVRKNGHFVWKSQGKKFQDKVRTLQQR